ncbi:MAG: hypothetical protein R3A52_07345 [Polyangiales bacterium]
MSEFIKEAIREKAARELVSLRHREHAFGGIDRARDALFTVAADLTDAAGAVGQVSSDPQVATKLKKLRKLVDDAHVLATEIADAIGTDVQRDALSSQKTAILDALKAAGIDPDTMSEASA